MLGGIYQIRNTITQKVYIGSARYFFTRWKKHERLLNAGTHHNAHLQSAWEKYGASVFRFEVLEIVAKSKQLCATEQRYLDAIPRKQRYNIRHVAESNLGLRHTPITRQRMRESNRHLSHTEEAKEKNRQAHLGKKATKSTRQKMSRTRKGRNQSTEHAAKRTAATARTLRRKSILNWDLVDELRRLRVEGMSYAALARRYGISNEHARKIALDLTWCSKDRLLDIRLGS